MHQISTTTKDKIKSLKQDFENIRQKIKSEFYNSQNAIKACSKNSENADNFIKKLFKLYSLSNSNVAENVCVCAVGGYGRKHLAPFSDLDILVIYKNSLEMETIEKLIKFCIYPLWDLHLKVGYAVRNEEEALYFSKEDHVIRTSMLDSRLICGSNYIFNKITRDYAKEVESSGYDLLKEKINERENKIIDLGYDYFRNEPNIKESSGSIRDINLIFWSLKIFKLHRKKRISEDDLLTKNEKKKLESSLEFHLRIRCFLHYESERNNDKLSFEYQNQISKIIFTKVKFNEKIEDSVEVMMRSYFLQIRNTKNLASIIVGLITENLQNKREITMPKKVNLKNTLSSFLKNIISENSTVKEQRVMFECLGKIEKSVFFEKNNIEYFKEILFSDDKRKLMLLNDLGILSKIIPEFSKIIDLPQYDRYHSLTVGQHTIRALNILKDLTTKNYKNSTYDFAVELLKQNQNLKSLYYGVLLHDIGKGSGGNHNNTGAFIASRVLKRLNESDLVVKEAQWLVKNHLMMSEVAFKKDLEDFSLIKKAASSIKSLKRLKNIFLLTVLDISAVDHGLWNEWKATLLNNLYSKLEKEILNPQSNLSLNEKILQIKKQVVNNSHKINQPVIEEFSKITYPNYWLLQSKEMIIYQIENFFIKKNKPFGCKILSESSVFYTVVIFTKDRQKLFLDLISIFASVNVSIHQARIFTLADGSVIDTFTISIDPILAKDYHKDFIKELHKKLSDVQNIEVDRLITPKIQSKFVKKKIEISLDNQSSSTYTVLNVITNDRPRLLYDISRILLKNKLLIFTAKISTNGDFVEDSFHLRTEYGSKLISELKIKSLKAEIFELLSDKDI